MFGVGFWKLVGTPMEPCSSSTHAYLQFEILRVVDNIPNANTIEDRLLVVSISLIQKYVIFVEK